MLVGNLETSNGNKLAAVSILFSSVLLSFFTVLQRAFENFLTLNSISKFKISQQIVLFSFLYVNKLELESRQLFTLPGLQINHCQLLLPIPSTVCLCNQTPKIPLAVINDALHLALKFAFVLYKSVILSSLHLCKLFTTEMVTPEAEAIQNMIHVKETLF